MLEAFLRVRGGIDTPKVGEESRRCQRDFGLNLAMIVAARPLGSSRSAPCGVACVWSDRRALAEVVVRLTLQAALVSNAYSGLRRAFTGHLWRVDVMSWQVFGDRVPGEQFLVERSPRQGQVQVEVNSHSSRTGSNH